MTTTVRRVLLRSLVACTGLTLATAPAGAQQPVTRAQAVEAALARGPRIALAATDTSAARAELMIQGDSGIGRVTASTSAFR